MIKDLKERFARIQLQVSPPLVAFRESVFLPSESSDAVVSPAKVTPVPKICLQNPHDTASSHHGYARCNCSQLQFTLSGDPASKGENGPA